MPEQTDRSRIVILVVDGEVVARNHTALTLHRDGYTVLAAAHGKEALDLSRAYQGRIDLLITDLDVPKLDGLALCAAMASERPELKVLATSANEANAERATHRSVPFLLKPLDAELLRQKFSELLN
jgi:CheY-like chemotaxis protein